MEGYERKKELTIRELKRLVESYSEKGEPPPRAIGGPYSLTPEQMIAEIEKDTEIGRQIVGAFSSIRKDHGD